MSATLGQTTPGLDALSLEILNVMADDCENLEHVYRGVCYELVAPLDDGCAAPSELQYRPLADAPLLWEVVEHLRDLIARSYVTPVMDEEGRPWSQTSDASVLWLAWFAMTAAGRAEWERWASNEQDRA